MNIQVLRNFIKTIKPADTSAIKAATERQAILAKPPGSLGGLEDMSIRIAGMTGNVINNVDKSCVIVFCSDNGVVEEGVASSPVSVTMSQTINFTRRLTGVGALAECFGSELLIVDMGVKDPIPDELYTSVPMEDTHKIVNRKIRRGTDNLAKGPAMSREEALRAIDTGIEMANAAVAKGYNILGVGEMGIGNTTTSAAIISSISGKSATETVGRGGGLLDDGFARKKAIVNDRTADFRAKAKDDSFSLDDIIDIISTVGGFDICAMAGAFLGAAANRTPVVIDGVISVTAALVAYAIVPESVNYMIASHLSAEPGYKIALDILGLKPFLALGMRLGEGSGCPVAFQVIKGACDVMKNMATFDEAAINDDYLIEIRKGGAF